MNNYIITETREGTGRYHYTSSDKKINCAFVGFSRAAARRKLMKRFPYIVDRAATYNTK